MEEYQFTAEINELMNMIIHNFYSNEEVFLRELISNSSDAINKLKQLSLTDQSLLQNNVNFEIRINVDKQNSTITIEDSGIGMTKEDLINNLGTIAKSGTKEFVKKLTTGNNNSLIGQFGVGFYSAYLVADNVHVETKHALPNSDAYLWKSNASGTFTLERIENSSLDRGTRITLFVKESSQEYLNDSKILDVIKKHSSYIEHPIMLHRFVTETEEVDREDQEEDQEMIDDLSDGEVEQLENEFNKSNGMNSSNPNIEELSGKSKQVEELNDESESKQVEELNDESESKQVEELNDESESKQVEELNDESESKQVEELNDESESKQVEELNDESESKQVEKVANAETTIEDVDYDSDENNDKFDEDTFKNNVCGQDCQDDHDHNYDNTAQPKTNKKTIEKTVERWEKVNYEPLWTRSMTEITNQQYNDFYKSITGDKKDPLAFKHFKLEGQHEFTGLIYVPGTAPHDLFEKNAKKSNMKLYVKRVLITENCEDLVPEWLTFAKGLLDSYDIQLNASRELLQQSKIMKQTGKHFVKKAIEMLSDLSENNEKYKEFYANFDKNIKLGVHEESDVNRNKLIDLLRFNSTQGDFVGFAEYASRMKEGQPGIYFISGDSINNLEMSPFLDKIKKRQYEIIYMTDPIDEYNLQHLSKYKDIKLINITKDDLELNEDKVDTTEYNDFCQVIKGMLNNRVGNVVISEKIESEPAIITNPMGMSANMERIAKAQALASNKSNPMMEMMSMYKTLEINPEHPAIKKLKSMIDNGTNSEGAMDLLDVIYGGALLSGGFNMPNIHKFLEKVYAQIN
jgi:molecular chaperone HtpG